MSNATMSTPFGNVTPELMANITTELHPGALRYYEEAGIATETSQ